MEQLDRTVYLISEEEVGQKAVERFEGVILNDLSLIGKMQPLGWYTGSVQDAGCFYTFYREDGKLGAELHFSGTYIGGQKMCIRDRRETWICRFRPSVAAALMDVSVRGAVIEEAVTSLVREELKTESDAGKAALLLTSVFEMGLDQEMEPVYEAVSYTHLIFDCKALPGNRIIADGQDTIINFIYIILGYVLGSTGSQNASAAETGLCF